MWTVYITDTYFSKVILCVSQAWEHPCRPNTWEVEVGESVSENKIKLTLYNKI